MARGMNLPVLALRVSVLLVDDLLLLLPLPKPPPTEGLSSSLLELLLCLAERCPPRAPPRPLPCTVVVVVGVDREVDGAAAAVVFAVSLFHIIV